MKFVNGRKIAGLGVVLAVASLLAMGVLGAGTTLGQDVLYRLKDEAARRGSLIDQTEPTNGREMEGARRDVHAA